MWRTNRGHSALCVPCDMLYLRLLKESFLFAWQAIVTNKLRTFLSLLGVMVGIFVITCVFTLVDSMEDNLKSTFSIINDDVLFVQIMPWGPEADGEYKWWEYFQRLQPTIRDKDALEERMVNAAAVAFQTGTMGRAERGSNTMESAQIAGVSKDYEKCITINIDQGRYITDIEFQGGRPVAVIGADVADMLFPNGNAIGNDMKVKGLKVTVVGTFKREGVSLFSDGFDQIVMLPAKFSNRIINVRNADASILVKAGEGVSMDMLKDEVIQNFRSVRKVRPKEDNDFAVNQMDSLTAFLDSIFASLEIGGWFIGGFAILVGCFSIANIMFVSVRERTRIIGIQKALGSKNAFILGQFLFESIALCVFGALMALGLIWIVILIVNLADIGFTLGMHFNRFFIAMVIAVVSGLIAGIAPAVKAARMDPVEAMRG